MITAPPVLEKAQPGKGPGKSLQAVPGAPGSAARVNVNEREPVIIDANECERDGSMYTLHGNVEVTFKDYTFRGDQVTYDAASGEATSSCSSN